MVHKHQSQDSVDAHPAISKALTEWISNRAEVSKSCLSGLWLLVGELDRSHEISQADHSSEGSYWHAIMHRTEGDFENAKYWLRRVGQHAIQNRLCAEIAPLQALDSSSSLPWKELLEPGRVAFTLVDLVRFYHSNQSELLQTELLEQIAWIEWQLLFRHCIGMVG